VTGRSPRESVVYLQHVLALFRPNRPVPSFDAYRQTPGDLKDWSDADFKVLIDEGRRQLDRQRQDLERLQGRSQFLFTTSLALLVVTMALLTGVLKEDNEFLTATWVLGTLMIGVSMFGAAALFVARAELAAIDAANLSWQEPPIAKTLAEAYSRMMVTGENTLATRLTVYRQAVLLLLLGAAIHVVVWWLTR
jgi:hypothetical protein